MSGLLQTFHISQKVDDDFDTYKKVDDDFDQILQTYRGHIMYSLVDFNTIILEVMTFCQETLR